MSDEDAKKATDWLLSLENQSGVLARDFMQKHGHRGLNELHLSSAPWDSNPQAFIDMIKVNFVIILF